MRDLQASEGLFVYLLGMVITATQPRRFWLGVALALLPIVTRVLLKTYDTARGRSW